MDSIGFGRTSGRFVTPATGNRVNYGGELLFHFGLTFDFELL